MVELMRTGDTQVRENLEEFLDRAEKDIKLEFSMVYNIKPEVPFWL